MSGQVHFFATKEDLVPVLAAVEAKRQIKYVLAESSGSNQVKEYARAVDLPDLGRAAFPDAIACRLFLVTDHELVVEPRRIPRSDGTVWYAIDQLESLAE